MQKKLEEGQRICVLNGGREFEDSRNQQLKCLTRNIGFTEIHKAMEQPHTVMRVFKLVLF